MDKKTEALKLALELLDKQWQCTQLWSLEEAQDVADNIRKALAEPPAQPNRPWVGLTDEEIKRMAAKWFLSMYWPLCNTFARAIETKLREKNA